ncbi:MAG TPA: FAD synthetase family protein [Rectinemataceae bacterium]|nr:FAD synthetase family protein [Rectinemataceae bacterium]
MKVVDWEDFAPDPDGLPLAAAIGVFDGLHLGHRALIDLVLSRGGMRRGVVTFRENPKKLLRPASFHGNLSTLSQKLELLESMALEICVLIDFSGDFSRMAGRKFLSLLRERGDLRYLAVGSDFRCGHRLDTGAHELREFFVAQGVEADILDPVLRTGHPVSSSRIRKAVVDGRLEDARGMLGRDYEIDLRGCRPGSGGNGSLHFAPGGVQVAPPAGLYEAELVGPDGRLATRAAFDGKGWEVEAGPGDGAAFPAEPVALRVVRSVSTE